MAAAAALTLLALAGVIGGVFLGQSRELSSRLAAAGGGLLFGIALFWLMPEIAETSGWAAAILLPVAAACVLGALDKLLVHTGHSPRHGVLGPLLAATALHSFVDGWSVRALSVHPLTSVTVVIGLGLHKFPEGVALGWITRKSMSSSARAAAASGGVEALTLLGAVVERRTDVFGAARFGAWWTAVVLAIIAGSFLFLGTHAVLPERRSAGVMILFVLTLAAIAGLRVVH